MGVDSTQATPASLRSLADLSEIETAEHLGIPRGTVKSVTHRAVAKLRASAHLTDGVTS